MFTSRRFHIALLTVICTVLGAAAGAPGASAATPRYASPIGAGNACSAEDPCKVDWAINDAKAGEEVIVTPGNYYVAYAIKNSAGVDIHGVAGQPRPKIHLSSGSTMQLQDVKLSYLEVDQDSPSFPALVSTRSTLDQLILRGGTQAQCAAVNAGGIVRNSIVIARNPSGDAACSPGSGVNAPSVYLNVTAIAQSGAAIKAIAGIFFESVDVQAINVIAKAGATGAGFEAENSGADHVTIVVSHSNYFKSYEYGQNAHVISAGGNQGDPAFLDDATGDYRQKPGSVTIDAGQDDSRIGLFDIDGDPRTVGQIDIGADEYFTGPTGGDASPTTVPSGGGTSTPTSPASGFAGVKLLSSRLTLKKGFVTAKLSCPAATAGRCTGVTKLSARRKRAGSRSAATIGLGRARFSIAAGGQAKLKVRLSRAGRRLFAHTRRLRGRAATAAHDGAGVSKTTIARVTIRKGTR